MKKTLFAIAVFAGIFATSCQKESVSVDEEATEQSLSQYALPGVFSVSADTKVHFSKGNIYCDGVSLKFESNQYSTATAWLPTHVSHFYWSMYTIMSIEERYTEASALPSDILFSNAGPTTPGPSFICAGGKGVWRTLSGGTDGEWKYLLDRRPGVAVGSVTNARYAAVRVNGLAGLLVFPDTFTWPADVASKPTAFNASSLNWNGVNYNVTDFAKLESAGCVFLPTAGGREISEVSLVNDFGSYWSSKPKDSEWAYCLSFADNYVTADESSLRKIGYSIRLVTAAR